MPVRKLKKKNHGRRWGLSEKECEHCHAKRGLIARLIAADKDLCDICYFELVRSTRERDRKVEDE